MEVNGQSAIVTGAASGLGAAAARALAEAGARVALLDVDLEGAERTAAKIVGRDGPMPLDDFKRVIDINLVGIFNVMRLGPV